MTCRRKSRNIIVPKKSTK
jgi:hypothetical protein